MKKLAIDSFVVAVSLGVGIVVGYIAGWTQLDDFRRDAEQRGLYRRGQWIAPDVHEEWLRLGKPPTR